MRLKCSKPVTQWHHYAGNWTETLFSNRGRGTSSQPYVLPLISIRL